MKYLIILICLGLCASSVWGDEIDDLIPHIIQVESSGNPYAVSEDGCIGLMQISRIVLREYNEYIIKENYDGDLLYFNIKDMFGCELITNPPTKESLYFPQFNVSIGTWYLRRLKDHYLKEHYTIERLLAAYNGGITRLRKNNYDISKMPRETKNYVKKVLKLYSKTK